MNFVDRYEFERRLDSTLQGAAFEQHALLYMELGGLKTLAGALGQTASAALLRQCEQLLLVELGNDYLFTRLDSDKFCLLLRHCQPDQALQAARLLRAVLQNSLFEKQYKPFKLSVAIGLVLVAGCSKRQTRALATAEKAYREAKRKGYNCIHITHLCTPHGKNSPSSAA